MTLLEPLALESTPVTIGRAPTPALGRNKTGIGENGPDLLPLDAGEQYRFGFSMESCIGCHSCEVACAEQNGLPAGTAWRRVGEIEGGQHPDTRRWHLSMSCNHCLDPACLDGCPTKAYEKLPNGIVEHHADDCIGCQYCTWKCPYSVPVFQPDRRIVTKCDLCAPRLGAGLKPACVDACPTHAITVEKVNVAEWRADHRAGDAPELPSADITLSTTRIELPRDLPADAAAASDWDLRPEHPHWPLVWLTLLTQAAVGTSATGRYTGSGPVAIAAALLAGIGLAGSLLHLGRPALAWKALRNLRRSWLSREVALFGAYAAVAALNGAVVIFAGEPSPGLGTAATAIGLAGVYASGRLYVVPGRPAWDTPITIGAFLATGAVLGPMMAGQPAISVGAVGFQLLLLGANLARLSRRRDRAWRGTVHLYLHRFGRATSMRVLLALGGAALALVGNPLATLAAVVAVAIAELLGRWLFYVTVVPLNMPGSFWRQGAR
ncbi:MAG: DmsC/YnfH family molybdoenzyme membrane anchor subunit [Acidimicrobiia bacterium]